MTDICFCNDCLPNRTPRRTCPECRGAKRINARLVQHKDGAEIIITKRLHDCYFCKGTGTVYR